MRNFYFQYNLLINYAVRILSCSFFQVVPFETGADSVQHTTFIVSLLTQPSVLSQDISGLISLQRGRKTIS